MQFSELVKGGSYAVEGTRANGIFEFQVLDTMPWSWHPDGTNGMVPGMRGDENDSHVLVVNEDDEATLIPIDDILCTWEEHTALDRWLKAEKEWHRDAVKRQVNASTPAIREVLSLAGIQVDDAHYHEYRGEFIIKVRTVNKKEDK